jgi:hypothetical protein
MGSPGQSDEAKLRNMRHLNWEGGSGIVLFEEDKFLWE